MRIAAIAAVAVAVPLAAVAAGPAIRVTGQYHSNYLFEWCVWLGYAVYGFSYGSWGLVALAPPAIILASIFGVTGIPPTENQAIRSKGDAYRDYRKCVSRFVPMPPKARGSDT